MPTAYALLELLDSDGTLTVTALAERLAIDRTNVSRLCARLQQSGDIALVSHPRDGRARVVRLTPAGKRLARRVDRASATYFSSVASHLGAATQQTARAMERVRIAMAKAQEES